MQPDTHEPLMPDVAPSATRELTRLRRDNALWLLQQFVADQAQSGMPPKGLEQAFAARLQVSPSTWSQLKNQRPISDKMARQIEHGCGKATGWLDAEHAELHSTRAEPDAAEERLIAEVRAIWRTGNARTRRALRTAVLGVRDGGSGV